MELGDAAVAVYPRTSERLLNNAFITLQTLQGFSNGVMLFTGDGNKYHQFIWGTSYFLLHPIISFCHPWYCLLSIFIFLLSFSYLSFCRQMWGPIHRSQCWLWEEKIFAIVYDDTIDQFNWILCKWNVEIIPLDHRLRLLWQLTDSRSERVWNIWKNIATRFSSGWIETFAFGL